MKKWKRLLGLAGATLAAGLLLTACGQKSSKEDANTVNVGIMTKTDSDEARWDKIEELLKKEGVSLKFTEFTDYSQPNKALADGEVDINAFQHYNFLNNWNKEHKGSIIAIADTILSPIHLFSGQDGSGKAKYKDASDLPKGATIAVPNDPTNESRVLYILQDAGLIKLNVSGDKFATVANITDNPKDLVIKELDASQTARSLESVDAAFVNNNYAIPAGLDYDTSILVEKVGKTSKQWVNILAAQKDWEKSPKADAIKKLIKAYHTDDVKKVIKESSDGIDVPAW